MSDAPEHILVGVSERGGHLCIDSRGGLLSGVARHEQYTRTDLHTALLATRDARIAALEAGLRAFIPSWSDPGPITSDRSHLLLSATVGDVRRARALLDGGKA